MALNRWSFDKLIVYGGTISLLILFVPVVLFQLLLFNYVNSVDRNLVERGRSIARTVSDTVTDPLLLNDEISVYEILRKTVAAERDVGYVLIEDPEGNVVAHTFPDGVPRHLQEMRNKAVGRLFSFRTQAGPVVEISEPILGAKLGHMYIGLYREKAVHAKHFFIGIIGLSIAGSLILIMASSWFGAENVSRPLRRIERMLSEYPKTNPPDSLLAVSGIREVESLKKAIQEMISRLNSLEHERSITQAHMIYMERLAALGELAAGLTHEIRNPLDGMLECVRYLQTHPTEANREKFLPMIHEGLQRINNVMQHMLAYARPGDETTVETCRTSDIMDALLPLIEGKLRSKNIQLTWIRPGTCKCLCNKQIILQTMLNLVLNSIEALSGTSESHIYIEAKCDSQWVYICIEDNGPGIEESLRGKIFEPFFTTKPKGEGTGLGLSISREMIRSIGGDLQFVSPPFVLTGARFVIRMPRMLLQESSNVCCQR